MAEVLLLVSGRRNAQHLGQLVVIAEKTIILSASAEERLRLKGRRPMNMRVPYLTLYVS